MTDSPDGGYDRAMVKAVFPGSFDPPTYGHQDIIKRGAGLFDSLDVVIAVNPLKQPLLPPEKKKELMEEMIDEMNLPQVRVVLWDNLVVAYARSVGARFILRGVRALSDFDYEFELSMLNKQLDPTIETVFLPTDPKYFVLRSSNIKELLQLKGDISAMVPPSVRDYLFGQYGGT